jgi:hypothetical protein
VTESLLLNGGAPIEVHGTADRIGTGPWARIVAGNVVPDEGSARAERGRELARSGSVSALTVAPGTVRARVRGSKGAEYDVSLEAAPLLPAAWGAAVRAARDRQALETGVDGTGQSVHLTLYLETEQREPLVPSTRRIRSSCTCPDREHAAVCKHVAALAFVFAHAIDAEPSLLLRWRGCEPVAPLAARSGDPWLAGQLPSPRPPRALPPGAVVKRLGRSGIRVGGRDLAEALGPAYAAFAAFAAFGTTPAREPLA